MLALVLLALVLSPHTLAWNPAAGILNFAAIAGE